MIQGLRPQVTEGGKIKLGGLGEERKSAKGTWRMPEKYDEFVITKTYRDDAGDLVRDEAVMGALPRQNGKLLEIPIVLHSDDLEQVFPTTYALYSGKKLLCAGDGQKATVWETVKDDKGQIQRTGKTRACDCPCKYLDDRKCKPHGTLHCSLRVQGLAVAGSVYMFRTTSIISIQRMVGSLMQIKDLVGVLRGLPLALVVQPVSTNNGVVYCAHVELRAKDVTEVQRTAIEAAQLRRALGTGKTEEAYRLMLKAPAVEEDEEEQAAVAAEWSPESPDDEPVETGPFDSTPAAPTRPPEGKRSFGNGKPKAPAAQNGHAPASAPAAKQLKDPQVLPGEPHHDADGVVTPAPGAEKQGDGLTQAQREAKWREEAAKKKAAQQQEREPGVEG